MRQAAPRYPRAGTRTQIVKAVAVAVHPGVQLPAPETQPGVVRRAAARHVSAKRTSLHRKNTASTVHKPSGGTPAVWYLRRDGARGEAGCGSSLATPQHAPPVRGDVRAQPDVSHAAQLVAGNDATRLPPLGVDDDDAGYARHVHVLRRHGLVVWEKDSGPAGVERRQLVNAQQPDLRRREHRQVHPRGAAAVLLRVRDAAARAAASVGSRSVASGGIRRRRTHRAFRTGAARWARLASMAASTRSSSTRWSACSVGMPCAALPQAARCWRAVGPRAWAGVANLGGSRKTSPCNGLGRRARHSTHT
jgi:hypothetical protein